MFKKIITKSFNTNTNTNTYTKTNKSILKTTTNIIKDNYSIIHNNYKHDGYNTIKTNPYERDQIIKRENEIFSKWKTMFSTYYRDWETDCFSKTMLSEKEMGEEFGIYTYYNVPAPEGYDILRRKSDKKDEVVLDLKSIPFLKDINNTNLKGMRISHNHKYVGFIIDLENNEKYYGGIYDIANKKFYPKVFANVSMIEFALDENSIFYVENNEHYRPCKLKQHNLDWNKNSNNLNKSRDNAVYEEKEPEVFIETSPTKDNNYLIINSLTKNDSQISILDLKKEKSSIVTLFKRKEGVKYFIEHAGDSFYILSNLIVSSEEFPNMNKNLDYKLFVIKDTDVDSISKKLKLLLFPGENEYFEDIDIFSNHVVVYYKQNLQPYVLIHDIKTNLSTKMPIGNSVGEANPGLNKAFDTNKVKILYSSPTTYKSVYEFDLESKTSKLLEEYKIKGFNSNSFVIKETTAPGKDGESIPMTLLYKKDLKLNRKNKTLLMGYGAYGLNMELNFDHVLLSAAERGWVIAYAHLRGGYEKGKKWHDMGKLLNKPMVIEDYLACAYELIQAGYTHPNYLAAYGQSAGGAVVAQALNLKPEIFRAAILSHPFLDVLNTLLDDTLPLTIPDYQEYGNPFKDEQTYHTIMSYSPYDNLSNQEYPAILVSMSLDDPRVPSSGTLKYIQKLRNKSKEPTRLPNYLEKNICVKIDQSGHFGPLNSEEALKAKIWELMWLDKMLIEKDNILL